MHCSVTEVEGLAGWVHCSVTGVEGLGALFSH